MRSSMASPPRHHDVETLWKAAKKHEFARVKQLLVGASTATGSLDLVNAYSARRGTTALMAACMKRETEHKHPERSAAQTVQLLLEFGADWALRARDRDGDTALHFAAACNQVRSVEFLVRAGVDVFALNARGHTALDVARWHGSADVVDVLTSLLRIHSGWLFVRTTKMRRDRGKGLRVWKKRWAVALACDPHRRVVELALLRDRDSTRPHRVVLLDAETDSLVPLPKAKWLDRHNMFHADSNVVVQKPRARRFSRTNPQPSTGYREVELLEFAAESASQRDAWMSIVRRSAYGMPLAGRLPTAATATPPPDRMQWQPERPLPIVVSEPMVDGRQDLFGSESSATTSRASVLSPLGESHAAPTYMTLSPAHVSAAQGVAVSPRRRDEPSAPSFISMTDSLRMSELAIHEQSATAASKDHDASSSSSSSEPDVRSKECVICMDAPRDAICVPCGHVAGCYACLVRQVEAYSGCPICRAPAQTVVKIYQC